MARGYPDYFGTSIWPKYGTCVYSEASVISIASKENGVVWSITGSGVLFTLVIRISESIGLAASSVNLYIDNQMVCDYDVNPDINRTSLSGGSRLIAATYVSYIEGYIELALTREVPFHDGASIDISNDGDAAMSVGVDATHYVVT